MRTDVYPKARLRERAFTMVEILTAVAITTLIVFALVSMFNTSTKALLMGIKQKDVWESARASFGMVSMDVEKVTSGGLANVAGADVMRVSLMALGGPSSVFNIQSGTNFINIENVLQDFYMLSLDGERWDLDIYRVIRESSAIGVGTLYRFHTNYSTFDVGNNGYLPIDLSPLKADENPFRWPDNLFIQNASRMVDGVIHFRMVNYDNDGRSLYPTNSPPAANFADAEYAIEPYQFQFSDERLPATVDLEMFVMEPDRINEFRAQSGDIAKGLYLDRHAGSIQMFRTRIPIRKDVPELQ